MITRFRFTEEQPGGRGKVLPRTTVQIDEQDITKNVRAVEFQARAGELPRVVVSLLVWTGDVDTQAEVEVCEETAAALVALGWTKPGAEPATPGVVHVVEGEETGVLYAADSDQRARDWIKTADGSYGGELAVTALEVDRG